jgi:hypothetical protein
MKIAMNYLIVCGLLVLVGCTIPDQKVEGEETRTEQIHSSEPDSGELSLNSGEPWEANLETTEGIGQMRDKMDGFDQEADQASYQLLSDELSQEFALIFKNCTMTGPAHDQLHNYLLPMRTHFKQMKSENLEERRTGYNALRERLNEYKVYFK